MELTAKAFKYGDDINTDYIISGKYKFKSADMEGMAVHAMEERLAACAAALRRGGARRVGAVTFARVAPASAPRALPVAGARQ